MRQVLTGDAPLGWTTRGLQTSRLCRLSGFRIARLPSAPRAPLLSDVQAVTVGCAVAAAGQGSVAACSATPAERREPPAGGVVMCCVVLEQCRCWLSPVLRVRAAVLDSHACGAQV